MRLKLAHKVVIAIAIPVLFQIGFLCLLLKSVEQLDQLEKAERGIADVLVFSNQICIAEALVFLYYESQVAEHDIKQEMLAAILASLIVTLGTGWLFGKFIAVRLRKVVSNIEAMETPGAVLQKVGGHDEIAALNDAVIDTNEKIREAEQFQAQTARIVAQALERPLNQINDYVKDMKEAGFEELNSNGEERIERSLLQIARLRSLVKDLISLDKISRIGWELEAAPVDLAEIARTAFDTVQDYARANRIVVF